MLQINGKKYTIFGVEHFLTLITVTVLQIPTSVGFLSGVEADCYLLPKRWSPKCPINPRKVARFVSSRFLTKKKSCHVELKSHQIWQQISQTDSYCWPRQQTYCCNPVILWRKFVKKEKSYFDHRHNQVAWGTVRHFSFLFFFLSRCCNSVSDGFVSSIAVSFQ